MVNRVKNHSVVHDLIKVIFTYCLLVSCESDPNSISSNEYDDKKEKEESSIFALEDYFLLLGKSPDETEAAELIRKLGIIKNHKRLGSWSGGNGVYLQQRNNNKLYIIIRVSNIGDEKFIYKGAPPFNINSKDSVKDIINKLGTPDSTTVTSEYSKTLNYKNFSIRFYNENIYEIVIYRNK